jgi:hypothetical protein
MSAIENLRRELGRIEEPDYGRMHDLLEDRNRAAGAVNQQHRSLEAAEKRYEKADAAVKAARVEAEHLRVAIKALEAATDRAIGGQDG